MALVVTGLMIQPPAEAQTFPARPVKFVVPFTAGGGTDVTARLIAEHMGPKLGQTIVVENRPGASATLGAATVTREKADGYTLLVGTATLAANAVTSGPNPNFDLLNDFEFIGRMGQLDLILVVPSQLKIDTLAALIEKMRSPKEKITFGSPGIGAPAHLGGELLKQVTKSEAVHVPYKGESAALNDLLGAHITFQLVSAFVAAPKIQDGSLTGLAVTAKQRSALAPNVPTAAEAGAAGVEAGTWYFLAAPKGTPAAVVARLNASLNEVLADDKVKARLLGMGLEAAPGTTPASVKNGLQAEMDKWRPVAKAAGITN